MKSYLRFISRNKLYTTIEVVGLSIALAFVVFIATFVAGELGYDKDLKGTENIYLAHSEEFNIQSYTVGDVLKGAYPEIGEVCRFLSTSVLGGVAMEASIREETFQFLRNLVVKVQGDDNQAAVQIRNFYSNHLPDSKIQVSSLQSTYRKFFTSEENNLKLIAIFTLLVMMLSAMAMLAMSTWFTRQKARNWSLRKVFGCSRSEIFRSMLLSFLRVVFVAAVAALPLGWWLVNNWLSGYSYRIGNHWWIYTSALLLVSLVAVLSISWQAIRLMNSDPVKELKKE